MFTKSIVFLQIDVLQRNIVVKIGHSSAPITGIRRSIRNSLWFFMVYKPAINSQDGGRIKQIAHDFDITCTSSLTCGPFCKLGYICGNLSMNSTYR